VVHLDKRHFQNLDSHAFVSVAPSSAEEPPLSSSGSPPEPASAPTPTPTPTPAHAYVPTLLGDKRTSFARPGDASLRVTRVLDQYCRLCILAPLCTLSDRSHYHATVWLRVRCSTSLLWHYPAFDPHTHAYGAVDHTRTTRISSPPLSTLVVCDGSRCSTVLRVIRLPLLLESMIHAPLGVFFLLAQGRLSLSRSQPAHAIACYQKAMTVQSQYRNLHHLSFWEMAVLHLTLWEVEESLKCWRNLHKESTVCVICPILAYAADGRALLLTVVKGHLYVRRRGPSHPARW